MKLSQATNLRQIADLSDLVAQKDALLNEAIDLATVEGTWELEADSRGRPLLKLRLKDQFDGACTGAFAPEELQNEPHLRSRLSHLKSALLRIGHWRGQLQQLFASIRQWCQQLPAGTYVQGEPITIREERSGEYEVSRLIITSNDRTMRVEPVAAWIVGADGRVDLKGPGGPFILLYSQHDAGWFYLQERSPTAMNPLTAPLFLQLAEACLNG